MNMSDPATDAAMHLDHLLAFMRKFLHVFDVLVLNTRHRWNIAKFRENRWVMYKDKICSELGNLKEIGTTKIVQLLDSQLSSHP